MKITIFGINKRRFPAVRKTFHGTFDLFCEYYASRKGSEGVKSRGLAFEAVSCNLPFTPPLVPPYFDSSYQKKDSGDNGFSQKNIA